MVDKTRQRHFAYCRAGQALLRQPGADFLVADLDYIFIAGIGRLHVGPHGQQLFGAGIHVHIALGDQLVKIGALAGFAQHALAFLQLLAFARKHHLLAGELVVVTHGIGNLCQVAAARRRHDDIFSAGEFHIHRRQFARFGRQAMLRQFRQDALVQRGDAVVIETRRLRTVYRHFIRFFAP